MVTMLAMTMHANYFVRCSNLRFHLKANAADQLSPDAETTIFGNPKNALSTAKLVASLLLGGLVMYAI